ncbi:MAG: UDPGP type 1 family protein [Phycisphaerales bacterium]|jgi:UDP-N-acetylglucosamine/UDP-N-acetylgalactosamine diphosphorylase|nr:UDPGP type 1 family protein [Phycisphaerales bacterium]
MDRLDSLRTRLHCVGQAHLLEGVEALPPGDVESLCRRIESIKWETLPELIDQYVKNRPAGATGEIVPASCVTVDPECVCDAVSLVDAEGLREQGETLLKEGRVAAFTVAGGQGTRLGWQGPKGTFPASPVTGKPLFRLFAEQILAAQQRWGHTIRWYIMTSEANDTQTRSFFLDNRCFGLDRRQIMMFPQGMMPAFDSASGRVLLEGPGRLAMSPDGHGGSYRALLRSGALDQMEGRGVEAISYFQVDNPLVPVLDPVFLGLHIDPDLSSGEFTSKMVPKCGPDEKVGVFALRGGVPGVVEYSDLSREQAGAVDASGRLCFAAGNVAMHIISTDFARRVAIEGEDPLPWHRADKKVTWHDPASGETHVPAEPNAVKLERFVFDAMGIAAKPAILEVCRETEFAPIKNASGVDSAGSSIQLQSDLYGGWLEQAGVSVPRRDDGHVDAAIEISPLTAMSAEMLSARGLPAGISPGSVFAC